MEDSKKLKEVKHIGIIKSMGQLRLELACYQELSRKISEEPEGPTTEKSPTNKTTHEPSLEFLLENLEKEILEICEQLASSRQSIRTKIF